MPERLIGFLLAWILACCSLASAQQRAERASDKFQNVSVLNDMPADQMGKVMNIMSEALGVSCTHCHAGYDFAREGVPHKDTSRRMIEMTFKLNRESFGGKTVITCMTCHQGQSKVPDATLSATALTTAKVAASDNAPLTPSPSPASDERAEDMLGHYRQIVGLAEAIKTKPSTVIKPQQFSGQRIEPSGKQEVEVIRLTRPETWEQVTRYGQLAVTERYADGMISKSAGEKSIELKPEEVTQIRIEARLALGLELRSQFTNWQVDGHAVKIGDRPMKVLRARESDVVHRFMFDEQSNLLRRRTATVPTVLGGYVIQVDYEEYREIDGLPVAELTSVRMPSVRWQRRLESF